jgi:hypothetical protein
MSDAEAQALEKLAKARGKNVSEMIRWLITDAAEREQRAAEVAPFGYMREKVGEALRKLTLRDGPAAIVDAYAALAGAFSSTLPELPKNSFADPNRWVKTIEDLMTVSDADRADPRANREGSARIRAERMTRDEMDELANALQSLDYWFDSYAR